MSIASLYPSINPSLLLDFANSKVLDSRVTFTRTTTATYYDGVTTAKAEENLLLQSQTFDNASWTGSATVTANSDTAPDGTTTADTLNPTGGSNISKSQQASTSTTGTYTASIYARVASGTGKVYLSLLDGAWGAASTSTTCNLTTTWTRFTVSRTLTAGNTRFVVIGQTDVSTDATTCIIWGAQLEQRSSATAYTATTTQAITNYIPVLQTAAAGQARFDHNPTTGESLGLLIEEARTNLATYSADFSNAVWSVVRSSITNNTIVAPDGTLTGDKLVENTDATTTHYIYHGSSLTSATYTASVFVKASERYRFELRVGTQVQGIARFNLSDQTYSNVTAGFTASITAVGNGWYRCSLTGTATTTGGAAWAITILLLNAAGSDSYTGDGFSGLFLWGAQIEAGSFATSYIPTVASSVTRNADAASMTGTNFSSWFNYGAMTIYYEATGYYTASGAYEVFDLDSGSNSGRIRTRFLSSEQASQLDASSNSTFSLDGGTVTANSFAKVAVGLTQNSQALSLNGGTVVTATAPFTTLPVPTTARIGTNWVPSEFLNGTIKKIAFYPVKATNAQLQALTV